MEKEFFLPLSRYYRGHGSSVVDDLAVSVLTIVYTYLSTYQVESQVSTLVAGDFMALQVITPSNRKVTLCSKCLRFGWKCFQDSIGFCNDCNITDCS